MIEPKNRKPSYKLNAEVTIKDFANKQEKKIAKDIKGKLTVNSGAKKFMPGDIYLGSDFIDVKSAKTSNQVIITVDMLNKLEQQAALMRKNPVLMLNFPNSNKRLKNIQWVLIPLESKKL